jgi:hypothetical protein
LPENSTSISVGHALLLTQIARRYQQASTIPEAFWQCHLQLDASQK